MRQMQAKFMLDIMSIDQVRAQMLLEGWKRWEGHVKRHLGTQRMDFKTIAQYLPHRLVDSGVKYASGQALEFSNFRIMLIDYRLMDTFLIFGMALTISDDEMGLIEEAREHAHTALALSNDYFSWQKEYDEWCKTRKAGGVNNAVGVISKEHSVSIDEAKELCVKMIRSSYRRFCDEKKRFETESGHKASRDLLKYLAALETCFGGNIVWSQYSKRYNIEETNGNVDASQPVAVSTTCTSCGSSAGTVPTPNTSDLEEASRNMSKAVHESLNMDLPELSDAVYNSQPHGSVR
jgi:hypothetical protein